MQHLTESFEKNSYVYLPDFLDKENCAQLTQELKKYAAQNQTNKDAQCPKSEAIRDTVTFDQLLVDLLPNFEQVSGKKLLPTYAYARLYAPGEELKVHTDRESCEISATITLGFEGDVWPIYMGYNEVKMTVGGAVLYKGCDIHHGRKEYTEGKWQAQVFLHYVDANGPYKEFIYDKRKGLAIHTPSAKKNDELLYWCYLNNFSSASCDLMVKTYTQEYIEKHPPVIGAGTGAVDTTIRNVARVMLEPYKDLGGRLAAVGLHANQQAWKFNITYANQSEFLIYPKEGRYKAHLDTFMAHSEESRKLTILTFLNDDFKGGKFYIQRGHDKIYPPQEKGTTLVFPSFLAHGVEDVEEGTRYSAVCWLVGPFFK